MTLRQKSIYLSIGTTVLIVLCVGVLVSLIISSKFQLIENQKVDTTLKRVENLYREEINQIGTKLADWALWDDTYQFMTDKNKKYVESNLISESFGQLGIDEVLLIGKDGMLTASLVNENIRPKFPNKIDKYFTGNSEILRLNGEKSGGMIRTADGLLLYQTSGVFKSNGQGPANGWIVFGKYLDEAVLSSIQDLSQNEIRLIDWTDMGMPSDFFLAKEKISHQNRQFVQTLDNQVIAGYLRLDDVWGKPQAILRADVERDITMQGRASVALLISTCAVAATVVALVNYWLLNGVFLGKIYKLVSDLNDLGKTRNATQRLRVTSYADEIDKLRVKINEMVNMLQTTKTALFEEKHKGEVLLDFVDAIVVMLDPNGKIMLINKKGCEVLECEVTEIVGQDWFDTFVPFSEKKRLRELYEGIKESREKHSVEYEILTKKLKKEKVVVWNSSLIKDDQGNLSAVVMAGEDVTERKDIEQKREDRTKDLERLNSLMVGREFRMAELKQKIKRLEEELNAVRK